MILLPLFFLSSAWAQSPPPPTLDLNPHANYGTAQPADKGIEKEIVVREKYVYVGGVRFKQVEYNGQVYTVNFRESDAFVDCSRTYVPPDTFAADGKIKVTKHTSLYIETLRQHCDANSKTMATSPDIRDGNLGVKFKGDGPNATEKKIYVNPLRKLGGVGTTF